MRLPHYIKNILIFLPIIFGGGLTDRNLLISSVVGAAAFCLLSSAVYILNDIADRKNDAMHPMKKSRPIASGKVTVLNAALFCIALLIASFLLNYAASGSAYTWIVLAAYASVNILYSIFRLKDVPIADITILALGYLIRVLYGAALTGISISGWMYLTVIALSYFMGLGKRRGEFLKCSDSAREVLKHYNASFLEKYMYLCLNLGIVFYSLWTIDSASEAAVSMKIWSVPMVIIACMRYSLVLEREQQEDPIQLILKDKSLLAILGFYGIYMLIALYVL